MCKWFPCSQSMLALAGSLQDLSIQPTGSLDSSCLQNWDVFVFVCDVNVRTPGQPSTVKSWVPHLLLLIVIQLMKEIVYEIISFLIILNVSGWQIDLTYTVTLSFQFELETSRDQGRTSPVGHRRSRTFRRIG